MPEIRISSWNVNGIRSYIFNNYPSSKFKNISEIDKDSNLNHLISITNSNIICFQETRCGLEKINNIKIDGWKIYSSSSEGSGARSKDRYSGVAILVKDELGSPIQVINNLPTIPEPYDTNGRDKEGRFIALEYEDYFIINTYVPNAGTNFIYRTDRWDSCMLEYLKHLNDLGKKVIWAGDMNIARTPYDLTIGNIRHTQKGKNILMNLQSKIETCDELTTTEMNTLISHTDTQLERLQTELHNTPYMKGIHEKSPAGFTIQEREGFEKILNCGYIDCWRYLNPHVKFGGYTWWNLRIPTCRKLNLGWRIDYIITNNKDSLKECLVLDTVGNKSKEISSVNKYGSDHCPIFAVFQF